MNNRYHLADGSPRYGHRTDTPNPAPVAAVRAEEAAEGAARLGLDDLAAAIDRRLRSAWADAPDPAVTALRENHPEELAAAEALVRLHLGTQRHWRLKAQAVRDKRLADLTARRKASGSAWEILVLRIGLLIAMVAPPAFIAFRDSVDLLRLLVVGAVCLVIATIGGNYLTSRARVPVMPDLRGPWLAELRVDVVNATLVAILQGKGVAVEARAVAAGRRGWESIQAASKAVAALDS